VKARAEREQRFTRLFHDHIAQVRGLARAMVMEPETDDIVAATFRTAWVRFDDIPHSAQRAWLFGVARNHVLNYIRSERRREALVVAIGSVQPAAEVELHHGQIDPIQYEPLLQAIEQLSTPEREIIQLAVWHEMQPSEIATVLGIRSGAARVRLHRARQHLEQLVAMIEAKGASDV